MSRDLEETLWGCLSLQHGLGATGFSQLIKNLGLPEAVYRASTDELKKAAPELREDTLQSIQRGPDFTAWDRLVEQCDKIASRIVMLGRPGYPTPLCELSAPPPSLFIQGEWQSHDIHAVSMVGTRQPSEYGRKVAANLSRDFARAHCTVVSGLAIGIDAESHIGALQGGGRTLAVVGCGLDVAYPLAHEDLRKRIAANGALISEFPPGTQPQRHHFPRRNRLLSALGRATVVVEAGLRSGSLITAAYARRQQKKVFAIPGSVFSPTSEGTHALLKRGAMLATSVQDVLSQLETPTSPPKTRKTSRVQMSHREQPSLSPLEKDPVLALWRGEETCGLENLEMRARESGLWPVGQALSSLLSSLLQLEIRGLVRRCPGPAFRINFSS